MDGYEYTKLSLAETKEFLKDVRENGVFDGDSVFVRYKDGTVIMSGIDDVSNIRITNIDCVLFDYYGERAEYYGFTLDELTSVGVA